MTELLLKEKLRTTENKDVADVAKVRTLSVLRGLDPKRKGMVILFLSEAWLNYIHYGNNPAKIVIDLDGADLSGIDLAGKPLVHAKLTNTNLSMANFQGTIFDGCDLSHSNLTYANLQGCDLAGDIGPGLPTNISYADMSFANLTNALVSDHQLEEVKSLKGATLPNGTKHKERLLKQDRSKAKG
jgi:uncharacterized protein YjbI with pentapeptide repeats